YEPPHRWAVWHGECESSENYLATSTAMATGVFLIVVLLVGEVDSSRKVLLLPRSSTVFLHRISAVLPGDDGSGQRGRKRGINATANARFALRLHAYGETLALRQRSSGESIDVARRAHQDIVFRTKPLLMLNSMTRTCAGCPSLH
ncbi:MAG TPA: hypothetical protein VF783_20705, partial [Terriglobales bacterium]